MSRWPDKYVIALTGNIATGKSVVRKMLEHLGAFTIDADALSHQALAKGGPAHAAAVKTFGEWLLNADGEINRAWLGQIVFANPVALEKLEAIVHPFVRQAVDLLIKRAKASLVAIEAIKIIESGMSKDCDALWVVHVPEAVQEARLVAKRKLSPAEARLRMAAQAPQADKVKAADFVIDNSGSFEDTWGQVQAGHAKLNQPAVERPTQPPGPAPAGAPAVKIRRGKPSDAGAIAEFITQVTEGQRKLSRSDIMAAFGDKAYMLGDHNGGLAAVVGWKVENLVARVDEIYLAASAPVDQMTARIMEAVEKASQDLQCEAALVFVPAAKAPALTAALGSVSYLPQTPEKLGVAAWKEAAKESMPPNSTLFFKKLREDRVLRPV